MASRYPKGMVEWVKAHYLEYDLPELTRQINERFELSMNEKAVSSMKKRYKLSGAPRAKIYSDLFPEDVCNYIKANYKGVGYKAMTEKLWQQFGRVYTAQQIKSYYRNNHLDSGLTGHFVKGQASHNKGQKMSQEQYEKCKATMFKPGSRPHNAQEIGARVKTDDGYWKRKVAEPNVWEFEHKMIWQAFHGPVPDGMIVSFRDGDKDNLDPSNLILLSKAEHGWLNVTGMRSDIPEFTDAAVLVAKLSLRVKEMRKR